MLTINNAMAMCKMLIRPCVLRFRLLLPFASFTKRGLSTSHPFLHCRFSRSRVGKFLTVRSSMSSSSTPIEQVDRILGGRDDEHGGVVVEMTNEPLDPAVFASLLRASLSQWRQKGKRGVWIKIPIELMSLVDPAVKVCCVFQKKFKESCRLFRHCDAGEAFNLLIVTHTIPEENANKEGFYFHHAEPKYLMLVHWLPSEPNTLPANASHRVGIGAFVLNEKNEVLVVQEKSGAFRRTGVWKFPTGVVDEGEDICDAAVREVKEETGIDSKFSEILAFRQSHKSYFEKSDLFFVCMLQPLSKEIHPQEAEIEAAQWMPFEEYVAQPFIQKHDLLKKLAEICSSKMAKEYAGFSPVPSTTAFSQKTSYLYMNNQCLNLQD